MLGKDDALDSAQRSPFPNFQQEDASTGSSASQGKSDGGAEAMFKALDKNHDGYLTREEVKGTPHDKEFSSLDKNHDGKLSRAEHAAAPEHVKAKSSTGSSGKMDKSTPSSSSGASSPKSGTSSDGSRKY